MRSFLLGPPTLALLLAGCLPDAARKLPLDERPLASEDDWVVSTPEAEGFDGQALHAAFTWFAAEDAFLTGRSLLVGRHGRLVAEAYVHDAGDRERLQHIKSASKSVTSLLFGVARGDGLFSSLDEPLAASLPQALERVDVVKRTITLGQLLTMRSGLAYENAVNTTELFVAEPVSSVDYVLAQPLEHEPGTFFRYKDGDVHLLGAAIQARTGVRLETFAAERLFGPLGVRDYRWESHRDGVDYAALGLHLRPRDMLRLGQLLLQGGEWKGRQLVDGDWIRLSTAVHVNADLGPYGYYWWIFPDLGAFTMAGHGGQFVLIAPAKDLVIVVTAESYTRTPAEGISSAEFHELAFRILEAAH